MEEEIRSEDQAGREAEEAEAMRRLQQEIRNLPVAEHVVYMMQSLSTLAISRMGLTGETGAKTDLDQARLAIDAFRALMEVVRDALSSEEMTAHRGVLSQLQLSYVAALNAAPPTAEEEPSGATAEEEPPTAKEEPAASAGAEEPPTAEEEPPASAPGEAEEPPTAPADQEGAESPAEDAAAGESDHSPS